MSSLQILVLFAVAPGRTWAIVLGVLAAILTIALLIASRTRWGESKSLTTCVVLAALAHVWLLMYAYGTRIVSPGIGPGRGVQTVYVEFVSPDSNALEPEFLPPNDLGVPDTLVASDPIQEPNNSDEATIPVEEPDSGSATVATSDPAELIATNETPPAQNALDDSTPIPELLVDPNGTDPVMEEESVQATDTHTTETQAETEATETQAIENQLPSPPIHDADSQAGVGGAVETPQDDSPAKPEPNQSPMNNAVAPTHRSGDQKPIPEPYRHRIGNRMQWAAEHGGDADTEAAVEASLSWLVQHQSEDGSWNAAQHGGGRETMTLGENRFHAGAHADTGMTGLALLALLGAGHTHLDGKHAPSVLRGLAYLLREQMDSGDLAGRKQVGDEGGVHFARMYCHGMATLALAEAYGMTGDPRLKEGLDRAIHYTLRAQNTRTGGWRYRPGDDDPGDLSQFGWQAMSLHSYDLGGNQLPTATYARLGQFLDLVKAGKSGGLATYRPKMFRGQHASPAMTAEALACRMMLGLSSSSDAQRESKQLLLENLPGKGDTNLYYWYYATLGLFHFQDDAWATWNQALKAQLLTTQVKQGEGAGSWDPVCIWGGYGGRVYSTSLSCLCLEVYYRYLPTYRAATSHPRSAGAEWKPVGMR